MEIGSIIFDLRKSKKLSQRQLSEIIGVSEETIDKWEEDKEQPDIAYLWTLIVYAIIVLVVEIILTIKK